MTLFLLSLQLMVNGFILVLASLGPSECSSMLLPGIISRPRYATCSQSLLSVKEYSRVRLAVYPYITKKYKEW